MSSINLSFPTDADDYLSRECPTCAQVFKAPAEIAATDAVAHCPYCGHSGADCWWTTDQMHYIEAMQQRLVNSHLNDFQRQLRYLNSRNLRVTARDIPNPAVTPPEEPLEPTTRFTFACCEVEIKLTPQEQPLHCITCGKVT